MALIAVKEGLDSLNSIMFNTEGQKTWMTARLIGSTYPGTFTRATAKADLASYLVSNTQYTGGSSPNTANITWQIADMVQTQLNTSQQVTTGPATTFEFNGAAPYKGVAIYSGVAANDSDRLLFVDDLGGVTTPAVGDKYTYSIVIKFGEATGLQL